MTVLPYTVTQSDPALGLIALQVDETIEGDMRRMLPASVPLHITRVASGAEVSQASLQAMADRLTDAASLLPPAARFSCVGYGCTSATAQIGAEQVSTRISAGCNAARVTDPLSALVAACRALDLGRLVLLSPYVASVSDTLRHALGDQGVQTPVMGSFDEAVEARVARIAPESTLEAAVKLARDAQADAIFLSCTNLRTLDIIDAVERDTGLICLSSNLVLGWHMGAPAANLPGALGRL
ncbi:Asp/Glu racemase [Sulfitobacter sp. S190]|uniref:maleate cis-trans isomerase family protein n=1 Tax=Sulfitobacter sp. S190 TaxID=2867022 RepID=UPI0021A8683F|nr:Asp/Glu racemase [Sulfitobacter sp. S190]UWR21578.1 Asp/Glu racemase [Sulfitobacter sp. S190]